VGVLGVALMLAAAPSVLAAPPNDEFANAMPITSLPFVHSLDTAGAGLSPGEQNICGSKRVLWYRFTPGTTTRLFAAAFAAASPYDNPKMVAFTAPPEGLHVESVACDNDQLYLLAEAGKTYYIGLGMPGNGPLDFTARQILPATNDDFDNARAIGSFPYVDLGNGFEATRAGDDPGNSCDPSSASVWYRYTNVSGTREPIRVSLLPGIDYGETSVSVYTGTRGSLTKVRCGTTTWFTAMPGITYHLMAEGGSVEYNPGWPIMVEKSLFKGLLFLTSSTSKTVYGQKLQLIAHLKDFADVSRHVSIYATPYGGQRRLVASGLVSPTKLTTYQAEWSGGAGYTTFVSPKKEIKVLAKVRTTLKGGYGRSGSYKLYRAGSNPVIVGLVRPNHAGRRIRFGVQVRVPGRGWYMWGSGYFLIGPRGTASARIAGPQSGFSFRVRTVFPGDKDHVGNESPWAYFRVG